MCEFNRHQVGVLGRSKGGCEPSPPPRRAEPDGSPPRASRALEHALMSSITCRVQTVRCSRPDQHPPTFYLSAYVGTLHRDGSRKAAVTCGTGNAARLPAVLG